MLWWCHDTLRKGLETPQVISWWILTLGGPLVWLKKPMKLLAWWRGHWRSAWTHKLVMKPTHLVCVIWCSWSPLLALDEDLDEIVPLKMSFKPLWMMEKPLMGWRNINDPFCGHSCFCWGHGTLVCDSCYHDDDDLVWSLTCWWTLYLCFDEVITRIVEDLMKENGGVMWYPSFWGFGMLVDEEKKH